MLCETRSLFLGLKLRVSWPVLFNKCDLYLYYKILLVKWLIINIWEMWALVWAMVKQTYIHIDLCMIQNV